MGESEKTHSKSEENVNEVETTADTRYEAVEDIIYKTQGNIGYWQILIVITMTLFNIPIIFQVASPEVTAGEHLAACTRPSPFSNLTLQEWREHSGHWTLDMTGDKIYDLCYQKDLPENISYGELINNNITDRVRCTSWEYDDSKISVISQFNLACAKMPINNAAECAFSLGGVFGDIINGILSDRYGRRKVLMIAQGCMVFTGFITANVTSYRMYLLCRFILGYFCSTIMLCSYVICFEVVGGKWRGALTTFYMYSYSIGYLLLFYFSRFSTKWTHLQYSITLFSTFLFTVSWLVPESPRWALTMKNVPLLMKIFEIVSSYNRVTIPSGIMSDINNTIPMKNRKLRKARFGMLFKTRVIRWMSLIGPIPYFFCSVTYYGLVLTNNLYKTNLYISGLCEIAAVSLVLIMETLFDVQDDKLLSKIAIGLSGISCLIGAAIVAIPKRAKWLEVASIFARFFAGMMNTSLSSIICSFYPTVIRTSGFGWCLSFGNLALLASANIVLTSDVFLPLPLILLGICAILGATFLTWIPYNVTETPPDLVEEVENTYKDFSTIKAISPVKNELERSRSEQIDEGVSSETVIDAVESKSKIIQILIWGRFIPDSSQ